MERSKSGDTALKLAEKHVPDLILLDIVLPDMLRFEVLEKLKNNSRTKIVSLSECLAQGDLDLPKIQPRQDELGIIASSLYQAAEAVNCITLGVDKLMVTSNYGSEENFVNMSDLSGKYLLVAQGIILFANKKLAEIFQVSIQEWIGKPCWALIGTQDTGPCKHCPLPQLIVEKALNNTKMSCWINKSNCKKQQLLLL